MKARLVLVVALMLIALVTQAAMASTAETLLGMGPSDQADSTYLTIQRSVVSSGLWQWDFTLYNGSSNPLTVLHSFSVGLAVNDVQGGVHSLTSGHYRDYSSSIGSLASAYEFSQRAEWFFDNAGLAVGQSATFSFRTDLPDVTNRLHKAQNGIYTAVWNSAPSPAPAVPEPGTFAVFGTGLIGMVGAWLKRRQ